MWPAPLIRPALDGVAWLLAGAALVGCGFEVSAGQADATVDVPPDIGSTGVTCKTLHAANPTVPSGRFMIDPDGAGAAVSFLADCDMETDGGGWTLVFIAPGPNLDMGPLAYSVSSAALFTEATSSLIAYRNTTLVASSGFASFPLPDKWRTDTPFNYPQIDVITTVSVNGATASQATLRYGAHAFGSTCSDSWSPTQSFGRLCIVGTVAPFFSGFTGPTPDGCADSSGLWNARSCDANTQFSIAIR